MAIGGGWRRQHRNACRHPGAAVRIGARYRRPRGPERTAQLRSRSRLCDREAWRVDAFAAAPRQNRQGSFDDARSQTQALRGIYATRNGGVTSWDVYALHYEDTVARYVQGVAHERRWSLGTRVFGGRKAWDWNWEFAVQGGRFGDAEIRAWSLATDTGYTFDGVVGEPRVALLLAVASGDKDPDDDRLGTLNPFYPRGNYFGDEATLGPRNFFNIHPR